MRRPFSQQQLAASYYASQQYKYTHFKQKYKVQKFSTMHHQNYHCYFIPVVATTGMWKVQ